MCYDIVMQLPIAPCVTPLCIVRDRKYNIGPNLLRSPLPALSAPLTLKEYTTPVCSVSTMYCDAVFMHFCDVTGVAIDFNMVHYYTLVIKRPGQVGR